MLNFIRNIIPKPLFNLYHLALAWTGNLLFLSPSKKLFLIGVTGTKGKTSTAYFIYQFLEKAGRKTALTSTAFFALGKNKESNRTKMGMPGRFFMPAFLNKARRQGAEYAVLETTSEAILQHRQRFFDYNIAVFTTLSPEHIERHGGFEAYREAKEKLFDQCKDIHILNLNDQHVEHFLKYPANQTWGVTLDRQNPDFLQKEKKCKKFLIEGISSKPGFLKIKEWQILPQKKRELVMQLEIFPPFFEKFNILNLLLSFATARAAGISFNDLAAIIPQLKLPPGRMQEIKLENIPFRVFIDYAHEPLSLRSALEACREKLHRKDGVAKLICLTGAQGGGRDKWKRKIMGKTASELSDYVIVATEDPYEEDPSIINQEVLAGVLVNKKFQENTNCWQFTDRHEAIQKSLSLARKGDIVIFCGKGGEKFMCANNKKLVWDEEEEIKTALFKLQI